jgi:DNA-directed RNA polymerase specialized sigma24 family protein
VDELTDLLLAAQRGDRVAFAQFAIRIEFIRLCYLRMSPRTRAACDEANDVIQETLLRCWTHLQEFAGAPGAAIRWAWTICRNVAVDLLRRRNTRAALSLDAPQGKGWMCRPPGPAPRPSPRPARPGRCCAAPSPSSPTVQNDTGP